MLLFLSLLVFTIWIAWLDREVTQKFEGGRWALPAHVYSRPLELYVGQDLRLPALVRELQDRGYRAVSKIDGPGTFAKGESHLLVATRPFTYWDGVDVAQSLKISFRKNRIAAVRDTRDNGDIPLVRIEPRLIDSISPLSHEDRSLLRLQDVPPAFVDMLLTIEDRKFMQHWGVDPRGVLRAMVANIQAGRIAQGGSTITQQLVKNLYLTRERSYRRKITEMIMALLLEFHYSKTQILEAYVNEVYLGQSGNRAIHGFGLASRYYFDRPLAELSLSEQALLVAMIRGPSWYNPRRRPERARERRDLVIQELASQGYIKPEQVTIAIQSPLGVSQRMLGGRTAYPAFLDLVRRQIQAHYDESDLRSEGLRIFTTLDPRIQRAAEQSLERLNRIEKQRQLKAGSLQAAIVVLSVDSGEILALVGGRKANFAGFNRALEATRPVGSLIKPGVYLAALERPEDYSLATPLRDVAIELKQSNGRIWRPQNYDRKARGSIILVDALAQSLNLSTVNLGLELGIDEVRSTLRRLGIGRSLPDYPSLFLGAVDMTPIEVAQMYQTFANGGFRSPLRSIQSVLSHRQEPLSRYPLSITQVVSPESAYLLNFALTHVVDTGTAKSLKRYFPDTVLAGKTGTTDNYRDSWFVGYGGNYLAVVWLGRDDNRSVNLTGSRGAMMVWKELMQAIDLKSLVIGKPGAVKYFNIDTSSGLQAADAGCAKVRSLPFVAGHEPSFADCAEARVPAKKQNWLQRIFSGRSENR